MSFSYALPIATDIHRVRNLIPDTVESGAQFADEEIQAFLDQEGGDVLLATAQALETLAQKFAMGAIRYTINGFSMDRTSIAPQLRDRAKNLRESANSTPFEFESALDHFVDSSGRDRSNYMDNQADDPA